MVGETAEKTSKWIHIRQPEIYQISLKKEIQFNDISKLIRYDTLGQNNTFLKQYNTQWYDWDDLIYVTYQIFYYVLQFTSVECFTCLHRSHSAAEYALLQDDLYLFTMSCTYPTFIAVVMCKISFIIFEKIIFLLRKDWSGHEPILVIHTLYKKWKNVPCMIRAFE